MEKSVLASALTDIANKRNIDVVEDYVGQYMNSFLEAYRSQTMTTFSELSKGLAGQMEVLQDSLKIFEGVDNQLIFYFAQLSILKELGDEIASREQTVIEDYSSYKHVYNILNVLAYNPLISAGDLANSLGLEKHVLSNALRRSQHHKLWCKHIQGKRVYYSITYKGKQALLNYQQHRIMNDRLTFEQFVIAFIDELINSMGELHPKVDHMVHSINKNYNFNILKSQIVKVELQKLMDSRERYAKEYIRQHVEKSKEWAILEYKENLSTGRKSKWYNQGYFEDFEDKYEEKSGINMKEFAFYE